MTIDVHTEIISINDLRDKYFDGAHLSEEERIALKNYDEFRVIRLNEVVEDVHYKREYIKIQALANIVNYTDFLNFDEIPEIEI
jgi:hypothetical protein